MIDTDSETHDPNAPLAEGDNRRQGRAARVRDSRALAAWASLSFRRYFWVQALSMAGRSLQTTLIGFIVYDITNSDFLLGVVSFMQSVPQLLLAPLVGVIVDRFDRRRILAGQLGTQTVGLLALAILAASDMLTVPAIAVIVVLMGIANAFSYPAHSSMLPSLVPLNSLQSANAINSMMGNVARIAAPASSGFLVDASGVTAALLLGAGLYLPGALLILTVPLLVAAVQVTAAGGPIDPAGPATVRRDITDAIGYIRTNAMLRASLSNDIVPYLFGLSHIALLPAVAKEWLGGGASTLGLLWGFGGAGALFGTLTAGALAGRGLRGRTIWIATTGFGVGLLVVAAGQSMAFVASGLFISGFFQMLYIIQNDTLVQTFAEDRFRGRALAAQSMVNGLMPIGFLILGTLAEFTSLSLAFAFSGSALIVAGLSTLVFRPTMRDLR